MKCEVTQDRVPKFKNHEEWSDCHQLSLHATLIMFTTVTAALSLLTAHAQLSAVNGGLFFNAYLVSGFILCVCKWNMIR